jgi:hypothetical protein
VVAQLPTERGQLGLPRYPVVRFPAVRGLELLLGKNLTHIEIVGDFGFSE